MNRPNFENYKWKYTTQWKYDVFGYRANVEKYCDFLEKALNKACLELELSNKQLCELDNRFLPMTKEDWRSILLKDDR